MPIQIKRFVVSESMNTEEPAELTLERKVNQFLAGQSMLTKVLQMTTDVTSMDVDGPITFYGLTLLLQVPVAFEYPPPPEPEVKVNTIPKRESLIFDDDNKIPF